MAWRLQLPCVFSVFFFYLFYLPMFILLLRESQLHRSLLDGISALAWGIGYASMPQYIVKPSNCCVVVMSASSRWHRVGPFPLGSNHFRDVWATCLLQNDGGVPLKALCNNTTSKLACLFPTTSFKCRAPSREAVDTIFKVF